MKSVAIEICRVRCSGHMHRIGMCGGAIVLMDHPRGEREAMEVRKALAPDAPNPNCHQVLATWRASRKSGCPSTKLPPIMKAMFENAIDAHRVRRRKYGLPKMLQPQRGIERWTATVRDAAQKSLAANIRTHVHGSNGIMRWRVEVSAAAKGKESIVARIGDNRRKRTKTRTILSGIELYLNLWSWWKLQQRCISVVDGYFVVAVANTVSDDCLYVAAIRQEKDLSCAMHLACITKGEDGVWHLRWI